MKRILYSAGVIALISAISVGATGAFFSDNEVSNGNTFTAGSIDLSLGSSFNSEFNGGPQTFALDTNNNGRTLYTFTDLKPGDFGQGSFNLKVTSNESYACASSTITSTPENTIVDPESEAGDVTDGPNAGELQNFLQFAIFNDANGNGIHDVGEAINVNQYGGDSNGFTAAEIAAAGWIPVADPTAPNTWLLLASLIPGTEYHAGFMYCFGNFDLDGNCSLVPNSSDNVAQTDGISGTIGFMAVQKRNNPNFSCAGLNNRQ